MHLLLDVSSHFIYRVHTYTHNIYIIYLSIHVTARACCSTCPCWAMERRRVVRAVDVESWPANRLQHNTTRGRGVRRSNTHNTRERGEGRVLD
jgi:hypothetical protein